MLKAEVKIGHVYLAKIRGKLCRVKIEEERMIRVRNGRTNSYRERASGWVATNLETQRVITIKSAMRLRPCSEAFSGFLARQTKDDVGPTKKLLALGAVTPNPARTSQDTLATAQATIEQQTRDEATPVWAPDDARKTLRGVLKRIDGGRLDVDELLTAFCRCYPDATPGGAK